MVEFFTWMKTSHLFPGSVAEIITHAVEGVVRRVQETMRTTGMVKHGMVFNLSPEKLLEIFEDLSSKGMFLSLTKLRIKEDLTAIIGDETRASAVLEGTRPSTPWPEFLVRAGDRFVAADRAAAEKHSRERIDVAAAVITPIILKMLGNHKVTDVPIELPFVDERSPFEGIIASPVNFKLHHRATPLIASAPKSAERFLTLNCIDIGLNGGTVFVKPDRAKLAEEFFSRIWPHIDRGSQQRIQRAAIVHKVTLPVPQLKAAQRGLKSMAQNEKRPKKGKNGRAKAVAYLRTSSAANVGQDKDSDKRQRAAIAAFAKRAKYEIAADDWLKATAFAP